MTETRVVPEPSGAQRRLRHRLAFVVLRSLLGTPLGPWLERALIRAGHVFLQRLPGHGALVRVLAERHEGKELVARTDFGLVLSVPSTNDGAAYYLFGTIESETSSLLGRALGSGDIFVDVGANVGYYTLLAAARCGKDSSVVAFEAQEQLASHLNRSLKLNAVEPRVVVVCAAVTDRDGIDVPLFLGKDREMSGIPSLVAHEWLDVDTPDFVPAVTLDAALAAHDVSTVDVMKIDIEGAELQALHGMAQLLEKGSPGLLVLEVLPPSLGLPSIQDGRQLQAGKGASRPSDVVAFLDRYGLAPRRIMPDGRVGERYSVAELDAVEGATNVAFTRQSFLDGRPDLIGGATKA